MENVNRVRSSTQVNFGNHLHIPFPAYNTLKALSPPLASSPGASQSPCPLSPVRSGRRCSCLRRCSTPGRQGFCEEKCDRPFAFREDNLLVAELLRYGPQ
jgi:hypothetical protein